MMEGDFRVDLMQQYAVSQGHFISQPADLPKPRVGASANDQRFLLVFILGTYFGPDLKNEEPRKSALQRIAEGLPPYTSDQLGASFFKLSELESVYYYVLRNAHPSAGVKLQSLYKYLQGHLAPPVKEILEDERQFTSLFPPHLHRQTRHKGRYKVFEGMLFIDDPDISFIKAEELERFKQLTGLTDLRLDRDEARNYRHGYRTDRDESRQARLSAETGAFGSVQDGKPLAIVIPDGFHGPRKRIRRKEPVERRTTQPSVIPPKEEKPTLKALDKMGTAMLTVASAPTVEQWNGTINDVKPSINFTGTATARQSGPSVGLVDIGTCDDAYLFRIALPGVKKDQREFSCEVESDGNVLIRGTTTTGEQRVFKNSRTFHMKTQLLCPPGPFTVSFQLPGPVEPRQFTGNFGSDGILEGIVMKQRDRMGSACLIFEP